MNKVEKIKAEIERLKNELSDNKERLSLGEIIAVNNCYNNLIFFIDSLLDTEKDFGIKSNDLEEAAYSYVDTTIEWFDSEGNPCCYPAFIAGAQWQKEKIIAKACEWLENYFKGVPSGTVYLEDFKKAIKE